jgi:hypothetical protein
VKREGDWVKPGQSRETDRLMEDYWETVKGNQEPRHAISQTAYFCQEMQRYYGATLADVQLQPVRRERPQVKRLK